MIITNTCTEVFCVDSSASMGGLTDFNEVNEESGRLNEHAHSRVEDESLNAMSFEESKNRFVAYESFEDIIAIIAETTTPLKYWVTKKVLALLTSLLRSEITSKAEALDKERGSTFGPVWRTQISSLESDLQKLRAFGHSLKVHEEALTQFLRFRASCLDSEATQRWTWSVGDPIPAAPGSVIVLMLPHDITEVPSHLRCPISHNLMEDAVEASDGQTYSRSAIQQWFTIRKTSPLHGAPLDDLSLKVRADVRGEVASWIRGSAATATSNVITVTFDSRVGSFTRTIARTSTSRELHKLAYRGLKAKFEAFELFVRGTGKLSANANNVSSMKLKDSDHISIRIPEDADTLRGASQNASRMAKDEVPEMCLVKVFDSTIELETFGFWVPRDTTDTLTSVIWKYWRYQSGRGRDIELGLTIMMNVKEKGDGWFSSHYPENTKRLAAFFTPAECTGKLERETVFNGSTSALDAHSSHKVLKILFRRKGVADRDQKLTRLGVLKQMFEALVNRMLAYNYKNHVGLVKFSGHAQVEMPISHVLENFRRATNELKSGGDTALWDALALAGDQIEQYASRFPDAKKRIIVISDGQDTKSTTNTSHIVASNLLRKGISVDSVSLGDEDNTDLRTLSYLLGSYRFHPVSLTNALAICEMEPFLSLSQRPPITLPLQNLAYSPHFETQFHMARRQATATLVTGETIPPMREHPNMEDDFVQLTALASRGNVTGTALNAPAGHGSGRSRLRVPRLMNEIRTIAAQGVHPKYDIYISTADVSFWKIVVVGPDDSSYSNGAFLLYLHAHEEYPRLAPKARFVTKIMHPNVNAHGRIYHSIFDRDWTSDTSMSIVLGTIYGLLYQPEHSDPVNTTTALEFFHDPVEFGVEAREHARKHASKTREEWKAEILGE